MNSMCFHEALCILNEDLINKKIERLFNSIGSNIFIEFGNKIEILLPKGKKEWRKEWIIWIGDASWRLAKQGKYVIGSGDSPDAIQSNIQQLVGKRLLSIEVISQFSDIAMHFEDDYQLNTFFNWMTDNQWTIFFPNQMTISIDCSTTEKVKNIAEITKSIVLQQNGTPLDLPVEEIIVKKLTCEKEFPLSIGFSKNFTLNLENCSWRLEKNDDYCIGYLDEDDIEQKLTGLYGKKLLKINLVSELMDSHFEFEEGFILKTFSCCRIKNQWKIFSRENDLFFSAEYVSFSK